MHSASRSSLSADLATRKEGRSRNQAVHPEQSFSMEGFSCLANAAYIEAPHNNIFSERPSIMGQSVQQSPTEEVVMAADATARAKDWKDNNDEKEGITREACGGADELFAAVEVDYGKYSRLQDPRNGAQFEGPEDRRLNWPVKACLSVPRHFKAI
ncbi:unnamed protein product [Protopolystoma xenopodis]|uniref:Uncharacterized protein n=1 Tax=Protopolystoma xenopodis TaxID=117903 RepID=A0A3S5ATT8_9PLAT|nr:unnamed protein product [Protopolystoma xenopodis]